MKITITKIPGRSRPGLHMEDGYAMVNTRIALLKKFRRLYTIARASMGDIKLKFIVLCLLNIFGLYQTSYRPID